MARVVATRLRSWCDGHLGLHQFGFRKGKGVDDALQIARRLVEEVATSAGDHEGVELSFHDIEKAYPRVCRSALWDLLSRWGCDPALLRVIQVLHGGTSYKVRVHGGLSKECVSERGLREGCPSSLSFVNIYHAAVMMDFRARRKDAAAAGDMDEGIAWVAQVDGGLFRPRAHRKRKRSQLFTVLGDVEFADDTVTCAAATQLRVTRRRLNSYSMLSYKIGASGEMHIRQSVFLLCQMPLGFRWVNLWLVVRNLGLVLMWFVMSVACCRPMGDMIMIPVIG